ncbi:unnamed protein product [Caenorhabditis sp. 36 PRJEB53466]|nr:unnamed protein product [Caenorhabditis sp. 36 PRJEB53466]
MLPSNSDSERREKSDINKDTSSRCFFEDKWCQRELRRADQFHRVVIAVFCREERHFTSHASIHLCSSDESMLMNWLREEFEKHDDGHRSFLQTIGVVWSALQKQFSPEIREDASRWFRRGCLRQFDVIRPDNCRIDDEFSEEEGMYLSSGTDSDSDSCDLEEGESAKCCCCVSDNWPISEVTTAVTTDTPKRILLTLCLTSGGFRREFADELVKDDIYLCAEHSKLIARELLDWFGVGCANGKIPKIEDNEFVVRRVYEQVIHHWSQVAFVSLKGFHIFCEELLLILQDGTVKRRKSKDDSYEDVIEDIVNQYFGALISTLPKSDEKMRRKLSSVVNKEIGSERSISERLTFPMDKDMNN